jgi:hypothetical protein
VFTGWMYWVIGNCESQPLEDLTDIDALRSARELVSYVLD